MKNCNFLLQYTFLANTIKLLYKFSEFMVYINIMIKKEANIKHVIYCCTQAINW